MLLRLTSESLCQSWLRPCGRPALASPRAGITSVSHHAWILGQNPGTKEPLGERHHPSALPSLLPHRWSRSSGGLVACLLACFCFFVLLWTGSEPPRASSDQESILPTEKGGQSGGGAGATLHFRVSVPSTLTAQPAILVKFSPVYWVGGLLFVLYTSAPSALGLPATMGADEETRCCSSPPSLPTPTSQDPAEALPSLGSPSPSLTS